MSHSLIDEALKVCKTRYKLAQMIGTDQGTLSKIYAGTLGMPPKMAAKIADVAGLNAQEAAAVAIIENEKDPEEREVLKRVFFRAGVAAMLLFFISALSLAPSPVSAGTSSPRQGTGKTDHCLYIM